MALLPPEPLVGAQVLPPAGLVNTYEEELSVPSHTSERHTDTKDTAFQGCSCWQACSLPRCLEQTHGLAGYAGVVSLCPVCPLCRALMPHLDLFHDAPFPP